jgi:sarcosine oxidase
VKRSASLYDIQLEQIDTSSAAKRFPQFKIPENSEVLFEPDAGLLPPGKAILLYTKQAISKGAEIHTHEKVIDWKKEKKEFTVSTTKDIYRCNKIVITTGPWAGKMIPGFHDALKITRQTLAWVKPKNPDDFSFNHFPCWMIADDEQPGVYYGFPVLPVKTFGEPGGLKLAHHYPGLVTDPDNVNRQSNVEDEKTLKHALDKYFSAEFESDLSVKTCLYANSPDENFIIDHLPGYEGQVVIACGFSGHGFKFVSVVGEILADLITQGNTKLPIGFLNAKRFA